MLTNIFNLHNYLMLNLSVVCAYGFARIFLAVPWIRQHLSQQEHLKLARFCLLSTLSIFMLMPFLRHLLPAHQTHFGLDPILNNHALAFFHARFMAPQTTITTPNNYHFSFIKILNFICIASFIYCSMQLLRMIYKLNNLSKQSFCKHQIKRTSILFSALQVIPCCWSLLKNNYVSLPQTILEKPQEAKLALRHELQHIRQGDTYWLQVFSLLKTLCCFNPFFYVYRNWLSELQEFACDEALVLRRKTTATIYAQCLLNTAREQFILTDIPVLALNNQKKSILYRRINMIFNYQKTKTKWTLFLAYIFSFITLTSCAYALNANRSDQLSSQKFMILVQETNQNNPYHVLAHPEVLKEINHLRNDSQAKTAMQLALKRMQQYKDIIQPALLKQHLPSDLMAIPLVESAYRPLKAVKNPMQAAGIWQIIPSTANRLGLVIDDKHDERLNTELATQAAINYFKFLYEKFHDWHLVALSYEIGEHQVSDLINKTHSNDVWKLVDAAQLSAEGKREVRNYLAMLDATIMIMHHPSLLHVQ